MEMTKQVKYVFEFEIDGVQIEHEEYQFIDSLEGRRYRWNEPFDQGFPMPLSYLGTDKKYQVIHPKLVGSHFVSEDDRGNEQYVVVFDLLDVDVYAITTAQKSVRGDSINYSMRIGNPSEFLSKLNNNKGGD